MICKVLSIILLTLTVQLSTSPRLCWAAADGFVHVNVLILDAQKHPIADAGVDVYNMAHRLLDDFDEVGRVTGYDGQISYRMLPSKIYYIQASAIGYLPSEIKKVVLKGDVIFATFMLKRAPPPPFPVTTIRTTILDGHKHPVVGAFCDVFSSSGRDLGNLLGPYDLAANAHGHIEKTVRTGGILRVKVQAYGYNPVEKRVQSKPGVISLIFVLKRNGGPLSALSN